MEVASKTVRADRQLKRSLTSRHLSMIAIGGSIGTGLFVASGATIAMAGPGGALLTYALIGMMVYFLMTSLAELAAYMPVSGSFATYGSLYVEEGFGFALGWNYWYNWAVTVAADLVAAQIVMQLWFPDTPAIFWSVLFLGLIFLLNVISVKGFAESEFWFALIKVVTVIIFIVLGLAIIIGIMGSSEAPVGLPVFTQGDAPFVGGFGAMIGVAMIVGFSFQGTELVGIAAGESEDPEKNIPKAIRQVFWRILLFYVLAIFVIGMIIPYTDPNLLRNDIEDVAVSPFTLVFERAHLAFAASAMNAVILTAVLSAGNSGMYASTRMLYALAKAGKAPKFFGNLSRSGVPRNALIATTIVAMLCFLTSFMSNQAVYMWLLNTSGIIGFIAWLGIAISHYRFRKGYVKQGYDLAKLPYRSKFFPFGPIMAFVVCAVIILGQNYEAFLGDKIDWLGALATYAMIPVFLLIWLGYRLVKKSRFIRYEEMNFEGKSGDWH